MGRRNHVLDGDADPSWEGTAWGRHVLGTVYLICRIIFQWWPNSPAAAKTSVPQCFWWPANMLGFSIWLTLCGCRDLMRHRVIDFGYFHVYLISCLFFLSFSLTFPSNSSVRFKAGCWSSDVNKDLGARPHTWPCARTWPSRQRTWLLRPNPRYFLLAESNTLMFPIIML